MSTESSGLPERRFAPVIRRGFVMPEYEILWPADQQPFETREDAEEWTSDKPFIVGEMIPLAEADLLRQLVAAVGEWKAVALLSDMDYDAARRVPGLEAQMVAALDALLAVAPHWGES